jgi:hypothetical protein
MEEHEFMDRILQFLDDMKKHQADLPDTPDHILVVLKGHLLLEREINSLLELKLPNPDALKLKEGKGMTFYSKVCLLEALIPKPEPAELWDITKKLNTLRNRFAHNLSPDGIAKEIEEFMNNVERTFVHTEVANVMKKAMEYAMKQNVMEKLPDMPQRQRLQNSIFLVWHRLMALTLGTT